MSVSQTKPIETSTVPNTLSNTLATLKSKLIQALPDNLLSLTLYGSYARGKARPDSDVDILIVLKQANVEDEKRVRQLVYEAMWQMDFAHYISLYLIDAAHYHRLEAQGALLFKNIQSEGQILWQAN